MENIGCIRKSEPLFVKDFLGHNKTEFIEILDNNLMILSTILQSI